MKIKKFDKYGISLEGENRWLGYDNPEVKKVFGPLYTWDELDKEVKNRLLKQKTVKLEDYVFLHKKLEQIKIKLNSIIKNIKIEK